MAEVVFAGATKTFQPGSAPAVDGLDLTVAPGEFMVLVGPSGSGKTTALRMLAGLEEVDAGEILIDGRDVTDVPPRDRDVAMVFQNYALYPHMSVADNIAFGLKLAHVRKPERTKRVQEAAAMLGLSELLDRKPSQLSGGQRQRVAMGRAIVREPKVFLMDEPLSNLDAKLRVQTRTEIAALQARLGITTVYVTHDQVEAMTMGHRVAVMRDGRLQQCDTPRKLYEQPCNAFVAGFIGSPAMNILKVPVAADGVVKWGTQAVRLPEDARAGVASTGVDHLLLGLRPEALTLATDGLAGTVGLVEELGADAFAEVSADVGGQHKLVVRVDARRPPGRGDVVHLRAIDAEAHVFHPTSEERLG
jgi:multiple sugar transport system ATP-binding protein